jgi:SAM-dependent methyltransferase
MAAVLLRLALGDDARRFSSIRHLPPDLAIWNAETSRALHGQLSAHLGGSYVASEFIDPSLASGTVVDGVLHVDMQQTHFEDESLDYVLSSDVIEHIPWYQDALVETYRILKFGGAHIFTAPFYHHRFSIERRTIVLKDGTLEDRRRHWYHGDPLRPEGVLCFNVFAPELLVELEKVGFEAELLRVNSPLIGAIGNNGFVIAARKVKNPKHQRDMIFPD